VGPCWAEGMVTVMAAADHGGPVPDLYQLLGVPRGASREEIAQAWRRRARAEHPDSRPHDAAAPGRFRALAGAWQVLGDPARRAAYDRALARQRALPGDPQHASRAAAPRTPVPVRRVAGPGGPARVGPAARAAEPPLRAGPVRVDGPRAAPPAGGRDEQDIRLAVLAELALRYLARDRGRPW
jgi:curved DNA-binding protein CbpA